MRDLHFSSRPLFLTLSCFHLPVPRVSAVLQTLHTDSLKKYSATQHRNSAHSGMYVLQRANHDFCLKKLLPILNAIHPMFHLTIRTIFTCSERKQKPELSRPLQRSSKSSALQKAGAASSSLWVLSISKVEPPLSAWATLALKILLFKQISSI